MRINGFAGISLIDYPDKISSVVFTSPCNFRCPFCHNCDLIEENKNVIQDFFVLSEIDKRKKFIDGIVITGGEPTLQDDLENFLFRIKELGLKVKLDTNGYNPDIVKKLINKKIVDYISMDIKSSTEKYSTACGININIKKILKTIDIVMNSEIDYEFRTTCVPGIVNQDDIEKICQLIKGAQLYIIQQFDNEKTFDENFKNILPYDEAKLEKFYKIAQKYVKMVKINNILRVM